MFCICCICVIQCHDGIVPESCNATVPAAPTWYFELTDIHARSVVTCVLVHMPQLWLLLPADILPGQGVSYDIDADKLKVEDCPEGETVLSKQLSSLSVLSSMP